ncbi:uncharacterized protein LOC126778867 [Nymphalis io]|uniref:uncharacterized protein LOC126778867 n=1 Tax=Inachis io TaxID=171585 RepID=UPI002167EFB1|nr:uncharacterized protein LOC126778867 [Nymphalis io]
MGCLWSKEDEELPPISRSRWRGHEETHSCRPTSLENSTSIPRQYVLRTPIIQNVNRIVVPKVKPRSENSTGIPTQGLKCRPAINVESKLRAINQNNIGGPKFGKYKCNKCGRSWDSRLCWPDKYQICKYCRKPVYAHSHRELDPSNITYDAQKKGEHPKELCEKCKQLGQYCNTTQRFLNQNYILNQEVEYIRETKDIYKCYKRF